MRIIAKYIASEILHWFSLALIIITFTMFSGNILELMGFVMVRGIRLWEIIKLFLLVMPFFVTAAIPIALFFSVIVTFGKFSFNNEILALQAAGIGIMTMVRPVLAVCVVTYIVSNLSMLYVLPWTNHASRETLLKIAKKGMSAIQREKTFTRLSDDILIYVDTTSGTERTLNGVFIYNTMDKDLPYVITAQEARVIVGEGAGKTVFRLRNGTLQYKNESDMSFDFIRFLSHEFVVPSLSDPSVSGFVLVKKEYYLNELMEKIKQLRHSRRKQLEFRYVLHRKFSLPFACIVMGILGIFLGMKTRGGKSFTGVLWGILFVMLYYLLMLAGERMVTQEIVGPLVGTWLPNIVFVGLLPIVSWASVRG